MEAFDTAISFESLHHFQPAKKEGLFRKLYQALKPGGLYLECDYIACCAQEERLLMDVCAQNARGKASLRGCSCTLIRR